MSWTMMTPDYRPLETTPDTPLVARYTRLANETTGRVRLIMWKLADEARASERRSRAYTDAIDLHLVPCSASSSIGAVRTYA